MWYGAACCTPMTGSTITPAWGWPWAISAKQEARGIHFGHTRIGVHTGIAMVGNVGTRSRLKYSALGDMLNTGSRLEGLNKTIGTRICVSGEIVGKAQRHRFRPIGSFVVKGRHAATDVFEPLAAKDL
jgi:adenylate cyclase